MPLATRPPVVLLASFFMVLAVVLGCDRPGQGPSFEPATVVLADDGLRLESQRWAFAGQEGTAWRVRLARAADAQVVRADGLTLLPKLTAGVEAPFAAINGGFYDGSWRDFEPMGLVVAGGTEYAALAEGGGSGVVFHDGQRLQIRHRTDYPGDAREALQSIDRVIDQGRVLVSRREGRPRAPRSAVVLTDDAVWLVVLAADETVVTRSEDGVQLERQDDDGLTLWAFARYLRDSLGADYALNLDGGISTQLVVRAGGRRFTVHGQQGVLNGLVVLPPGSET